MVEQLGVWRMALLVGLFVSLPFVLWLLWTFRGPLGGIAGGVAGMMRRSK